MFQSRKQDYFNWKKTIAITLKARIAGFSPASRIILIESLDLDNPTANIERFQSRKQDYFNWKQQSEPPNREER